MSKKKLFISHASKDKKLVDTFVDFLDTGCKLNRDEIFYTSDPDLGIESGKDFIQSIKENINDASMIILMLTPNYYESVFCLGELGATWVLDIETFPIVIGDLDISDIGDFLQVTQMGTITDKTYLDQLRDRILCLHGIPNAGTPTWNIKRDIFLKNLPSILNEIPKVEKVTIEKYKQLENNYNSALQEIVNGERELTKTKQIIKDLRQLKDRKEVNNVLIANSPLTEQFEHQLEITANALKKLPRIVRQFMYYNHIGEDFLPEKDRYNSDAYNEAVEAKNEQYLLEHPYNEHQFVINSDDIKVESALDNISKLSEIIESIDAEGNFAIYFKNEHKYEIHNCLENRRFWKRYLF